MYASLDPKRLSTFLGVTFGIVLIGALFIRGMPEDLATGARTFSVTLSTWSLALLLLTGSSGKLSPWRMLWFVVPPLNRLVFPDLNGTWRGKASSNWPVIKTMLDAAERTTNKLKADDLAAVSLKDVGVEMRIRASFFHFRIRAKLADTNGDSHSLTARVHKNDVRDLFELYYVYLQHTPEPKRTDEGSHAGAAQLDVDLEHWRLTGSYWTRRSWRSGFNTAGRIDLGRVDRGGWLS